MTIILISQLRSRSYTCLLDGQKAYTIMPYDKISLDLPQENCQLRFARSGTQPITVRSGDTIILKETEPFASLTSFPAGLLYCLIFFVLISLGFPHWLITALIFLPYVPYLLLPHFTIIRK